MATIKAFAPAKVNLTLHVTGQRDDGYHLLDSLVVFADVGDHLQVQGGIGLNLSVTGPMAQDVPTDTRNSVLQAAKLMGQDNLSFRLEKNLPTSAGIGGGTSDAAAAVRAVAELRNCDVPSDLLPLGADVPVCALAKAAHMYGIGEAVLPVPGVPDLHAVLANPGVDVATPEIFKRLKTKTNAPMTTDMPVFQSARIFAEWLGTQRNDLEAPAILAQPKIDEVKSELAATGAPMLVRMSGSGATCFALYETQEQAQTAARELARRRPAWWVRACQLS
ncbi:MAG: 4-(cytidine 5'-diphospho)-2-C-methyl-D-erythritol kinase [Thalassovita sp.]